MTTVDQPEFDKKLALRLLEGDPEGFRLLYKQYHRNVYRYALKLLMDEEAARDVMQDTFLRVHNNLESITKARSMIAWLLTVARNLVFQVLRSRRKNGTVELETEPGDSTDPQTMLEGKEAGAIVRSALEQLRPQYREVLVLREYEQLSYAEIAAVTGNSESSVKSRIHKARKSLTEKLKPFFGEHHE